MSETTDSPADRTGDAGRPVPVPDDAVDDVPRAPSDPSDSPADPDEPLNPA